jgi:hypothetical protein
MSRYDLTDFEWRVFYIKAAMGNLSSHGAVVRKQEFEEPQM